LFVYSPQKHTTHGAEAQTVAVFHQMRNPERYIIDKRRYFDLWLAPSILPRIALTIACLHWQQQLIIE
jgi:hypothetical protein